MHPNSTNKLLDLKDVFVKKIEYLDSSTRIYLESHPRSHICPACGASTSRTHDYREQFIKDAPLFFRPLTLVLRKRRYSCSCGKRFLEAYSFLSKYQRMTSRLRDYTVHSLRESHSYSFVASQTLVSVSTVIRTFNTLSYPPAILPKVLCIDEFKGNAGGEKYQCSLVDGKRPRILDILPDRRTPHLTSYFKSVPKSQRHQVSFFVCDMWKPYVEIAETFFPNAKICIDKFHFIRQVTWAIENVRKRIQRSMQPSLRKYYKRSRKLLLTRYNKLNGEHKKAADLMLLYNDELRLAHYLKEAFYDICHEPKYSKQRTDFYDWIRIAENSGIKEFEKCAATYRNWSKYILNAFKYGYTNGPIEGFNNKIKVIKRNAYGIRNFDRFRNRIMHCCN